MILFYNLFSGLYFFAICISSLFNAKAGKWVAGRKNLFSTLQKSIVPGETILWMHCASLGEFEQGRPLLEALREKYPGYKILLTFFSPSGYEIRKDYSGADYVFYLPADTRKNAERFIEIVNPRLVIFVKYEFWYHFLKTLHHKHIPTLLVSANFRRNQLFFRSYGSWYLSMLKNFTHIFVQRNDSAELLNEFEISNVTISGDTRFDRVKEVVNTDRALPVISEFCMGKTVICAGSSWEPDEEIIIRYSEKSSDSIRFIIVPHEVSSSHIRWITSRLKKPYILFSEASAENVRDKNILIVDSVGFLSSIYKYSHISYVGGGFGKGIHNVLEPAVFGNPVLFGPNYHKFVEAKELIKTLGAFPINSYSEFEKVVDNLISSHSLMTFTGDLCKRYVSGNCGATKVIIAHISKILN